MRKIWCKIWTWLLNTVNDAVSTIAHALKTVGDVAVDLLTDVAAGIGGAISSIFGGSNFLIWAGVGVFAYFLLTKESEDGRTIVDRVQAPQSRQEPFDVG